MPAPVRQLLYWTTVLFRILYCKIKNVFFIFCVCLFFRYYLHEKYYKPTTVQYYRAYCVSWVPRLTLLDLGTHCRSGTCSYVGDLLYSVCGQSPLYIGCSNTKILLSKTSWFTSLCMTDSRSIHLTTNNSISFLFMAE